MKITKLITLLPILILSLTAFADTITVPKSASGEWYYPSGKKFPAKSGDVVKMEGNYSLIVIYDMNIPNLTFLGNGSKVNGKVSIHNSTGFILDGLNIGGTPNNFNDQGFNFGGSSNFTMKNCEISWTKIGVYSNNLTKGVFPNITFLNNYIHDIGSVDKLAKAEAFYIGPSDNSPLSSFSYPNLYIGGNKIHNCGGDAIQVTNAQGVIIKDNEVKNYGSHNIKYQQNGIGLGSNTNGVVSGNVLTTGTGAPFNAMGSGITTFEKNTGIDCALSAGQDGFYVRGAQVRLLDNVLNKVNRSWVKVDAGSIIEERGNKFGEPVPPPPPIRVDSVTKSSYDSLQVLYKAALQSLSTCNIQYTQQLEEIKRLKAEKEALEIWKTVTIECINRK